MARRKHGEGTIVKRADGRYMAALIVETEKGKQRKYFYGKTSREVQKKLDQAKRDRDQGTFVTERGQRLDVYLNRWLEEVHKPSIRASSYVLYRGLLDNHIIPALGHIQLQKLTPRQVQAFYAVKLDEGLNAKTVNKMHIVLSMALDNALKWNMVARNVCDAVTKPREVPYEYVVLTEEQAKRFLVSVRGDALEGIITLVLALTLRRGEVLGLKWDDVDFEHRCLYIRRTVSRIGGKMGVVERPPKSKAGRRVLPLPDFVIAVLHREQKRQEECKAILGAKWKDGGYVFPNSVGGYYHESSVRERFKRLLKRAGLPDIRFHDLRHSAATFLLAMGVNPKEVQELLGHSSFRMTMDLYGHVLQSMRDDARQKLDDFFGGE
jgi:integrase